MKNKACTKCKIIKLVADFKTVKCNKSGIDSQCISCRDEYYKANKEKIKLRVTVWAKNNKEKRKAAEQKYRDNNKDKCKAAIKLWSDKNEDRIKLTRDEYKKRNKDIIDIKNAEYRNSNRELISSKNRIHYKNNIDNEKVRSKLYRDSHKEEIFRFLGNNVHVDHIVPLVNGLVCGLHCIDNLQILPAQENLSKSNYFYV